MPEGGNTPEGEISDQSPRNNKLRELGKRFGQKVKQIAYKKGNLVSNTPGPIPEPTPTTTPDPFDNIRILPPPPETLTLPPQFQIDNSQNLPMPEPLPAAFPENPADMLDYLIAHNQQFDYSENKFTPEQIAHAVSFAKSKGWNLNELSPAQISSAQMFAIGDLTLAELAEDTTEKRTERLITHKDSHREILLPEKPTYFHATAAKETVDDIYRTGLYCDINTGLGGVAAPLERKSHIENNLLIESPR